MLDEAIVASLLEVLSDGALIDEAVRCRAHERSAASEHLAEGELEATARELSEVEVAIKRSRTSFERGSLPEEVCGPRVRALGERAGELRERQAELSATLEEEVLQAPDPAGLAGLRGEVEAAMRSGSPARVKALLQALVHEVRVEDASTVRPVFKIPAGTATTCSEAVRAPSRVVGREAPWSLDDAPASFVAAQLRAIVGVELVIERVEAKAKWSRAAADVAGVIAGLDAAGEDDAAAAMRTANRTGAARVVAIPERNDTSIALGRSAVRLRHLT